MTNKKIYRNITKMLLTNNFSKKAIENSEIGSILPNCCSSQRKKSYPLIFGFRFYANSKIYFQSPIWTNVLLYANLSGNFFIIRPTSANSFVCHNKRVIVSYPPKIKRKGYKKVQRRYTSAIFVMFRSQNKVNRFV